MAIQNRRGSYSKFDPNKMVDGEFAIVKDSDPNGENGEAVYIAYGAGKVQRLATEKDLSKFKADTVAEVQPYVEQAEKAAQSASDSFGMTSIVSTEINSKGHLIFTLQNMDALNPTIQRSNGHLLLEV